jgi:hypothetical protein
MTQLRARIGLLVGAMAWPAITLALALAVRDTLPAVLAGTTDLNEALAALAGILGLAAMAWLAVVVLAAALTHLLPRGSNAALIVQNLDRLITPRAMRRLVAVAVTGALVSGATPAQAASPTPTRPAAVSVTARGPLDPGWFRTNTTVGPDTASGPFDPGWAPSKPAASQELTGPTTQPVTPQPTTLDPSWRTPTRSRSAAYPQQDIVVRRGDTLWDIAARHLGPTATDTEIAQAWPRWFAANRAVIGTDPDRLAPGQRLRPPTHRAGGMP